MDPIQLAAVLAIVVGVVLIDRRLRGSGIVDAGEGAPWTTARLSSSLIKVAIGMAVVAILILVLQAARIEIGWLGFGSGPR